MDTFTPSEHPDAEPAGMRSAKARSSDPTNRRKSSPAATTAMRLLRRMGVWIPLILLVLWTVLPILITFSISFKSPGEVFSAPQLLPGNPTLSAYQDVFARPGFRGAFVNSVVVGIGTAVLTLLLSVPAAYAFARFRFRGRSLLLLFTLLPRLVPSLGLMVPLYRIAIALGALDSRLTLIVAFSGTLVPLSVWLLAGFFEQIPRDIEEAANVDGATLVSRLRLVVLPLTVPALITIGMLAFREAWNEFNLVLALTRTPGKRTLPYELWLMQDSTGFPNYPAEAAFAVLTLLPFILLYMRIERYVVGGITSGAVK